jgi:hypothetical protein
MEKKRVFLQAYGEEFGRPDTEYRAAWEAKERIIKDLNDRI